MLRRYTVALAIVTLAAACARRHAEPGPTPTSSRAPVTVATPAWMTLTPSPSAPRPVSSATTALPVPERPQYAPRPRGHAATPAPVSTQPFSVTLPYVSVTPRPLATTQPSYVFSTIPPIPMEAQESAPRIVEVIMPTNTVREGESLTGDVITSSNVASVEVRIANFGTTMQKIAPGVFTVTITVPRLPFFLRNRSYTLEIIARNTRGSAVTRNVAVDVR